MTTIVTTYLTYLLISVVLTIWVGRTLSSNGRVFLADVFKDSESLAKAMNQLLVVGFYLVNLGLVALLLTTGSPVTDLRSAIETLSIKVGTVLMIVGALHLGNVLIFSRVRRRTVLEARAEAAGIVAPLAP
jgi:hypothetical protein